MTVLFPPAGGPRVFSIPPGVDFAAELVAGLDARLAGQPPEAAAQVEIWVNTRRAQRGLLAVLASGGPRLLPRIRVLPELAGEGEAGATALGQRLVLARLVAELVEADPELAPRMAVFDLADSLADLLDEMQGEGVPFAALAGVDAGAHAAHWQRSLRFLEILAPFAEAAAGPGGQGRMRAAVEGLATRWDVEPPAHPVIVAGSTGSRAATRAFMAAVARLPQGAVVLPGLDDGLPDAVRARLARGEPGAADHPQYGLVALAEALGVAPREVAAWHEGMPPMPERNALVALALRPAPVTDQWRREGAGLVPGLAAAAEGLAWVEAPDSLGEARVAALALKAMAEAGGRGALVTPDRALARRVVAELDRWGLVPDDSAGRPLGLTPPGILLRLLAGLAGGSLEPGVLLAILKHPLVASAPGARRGHLALVARLEIERLRGGPPEVTAAALADWVVGAGEEAPAWVSWLVEALAPLAGAGAAPLTVHAARHRAAAEALAAGPGGAEGHELWEKAAGQAARAVLEALEAEPEVFGPMEPREFAALLEREIGSRDVPEEAVVVHPDIAIWGTLEARVQAADLVVLGGLNEGIWPRIPDPDPWLSRGLRQALGLPSPELRIGLSAHDFQQAMAASQVIVTRAARDAEAPTVPSRWLLRLENLMQGLGPEGGAALAGAKARGAALVRAAQALDRPDEPAAPARRPSPRPPVAARPASLSVTQIETLVRDPYAIYARHVLRLKPLDPPGREADALARGTAVHEVMERFLAATEGGLPADAAEVFAQIVREVLAEEAPWPAVRAVWTARLTRVAGWFLAGEAERREQGSPLARELRGRRALTGLALPFEVTAKADRIDRLHVGGYGIYDYKSGGVPSERQAAAFHLQLPLEGAILEAGGFAGIPAGPVPHMELIGLNAQKSLVLGGDEVATKIAQLHELIAAYQDEGLGYTARLRPALLSYASDYDHLSRYGEWGDGDVPEGAA